MNRLTDDFSSFLKTNGLSKGSVRNYTADLSRFLSWYKQVLGVDFRAGNAHPDLIARYREALGVMRVPEATQRRYIQSLKRFFQWMDPIGFPDEAFVPGYRAGESLSPKNVDVPSSKKANTIGYFIFCFLFTLFGIGWGKPGIDPQLSGGFVAVRFVVY